MMNLTLNYTPIFDEGKKGYLDFFVHLTYRIFPEMGEEFDLE